MKKIIALMALAVFTIACTQTTIEEENYEMGIQIIDKTKVQPPGERDGKDGD